jgi:hypothetical protein
MCGVAKFLVRRSSVSSAVPRVRQARVQFSAQHPREVFPTELTGDEEMEGTSTSGDG